MAGGIGCRINLAADPGGRSRGESALCIDGNGLGVIRLALGSLFQGGREKAQAGAETLRANRI
jgi:hypothetical protein